MPDFRRPMPRGGGDNPVNTLKVPRIRGVEIYRDMSEIPVELLTANRYFDIWPPGGVVSGGRTRNEACGIIWIWTELGW